MENFEISVSRDKIPSSIDPCRVISIEFWNENSSIKVGVWNDAAIQFIRAMKRLMDELEREGPSKNRKEL